MYQKVGDIDRKNEFGERVVDALEKTSSVKLVEKIVYREIENKKVTSLLFPSFPLTRLNFKCLASYAFHGSIYQ